MDSNGRCATRNERIKLRLKLLEERHLQSMAQYEEAIRHSQEQYARSLEQIEQATKEAAKKLGEHRRSKRSAKVMEHCREDVGEVMPVAHDSLSDRTLPEYTCGSSPLVDGIRPSHHYSTQQVVQSSRALHTTATTEDVELALRQMSTQEVVRKLPYENVKLRSKEQAAVQPENPATAYFRWSFSNTVVYDPIRDSDEIFIPSQSNCFPSVARTEEANTATTKVFQLDVCPKLKVVVNKQRKHSVWTLRKYDKTKRLFYGYVVSKLLRIDNRNINYGLLAGRGAWKTNTIPVTQVASEFNNDYANTKPTCYNHLPEHYTSKSRMYKREPIRKTVTIRHVSSTYTSSRCTTDGVVPIVIFVNSFVRLRGNGRVLEFEVVDCISREGYNLLRSTEGSGFDPGGSNISTQLQTQRIMSERGLALAMQIKLYGIMCDSVSTPICMGSRYESILLRWEVDNNDNFEGERERTTTSSMFMVHSNGLHLGIEKRCHSVYDSCRSIETAVLCRNEYCMANRQFSILQMWLFRAELLMNPAIFAILFSVQMVLIHSHWKGDQYMGLELLILLE